jgi:signal transduction histidine kinase
MLDEFNINSTKQIQGMSKTIDDFRDFFKSEKKKIDYCINDIVVNTVEMLNPVLRKYSLHVSFDNEIKVYTNGFPNELGQALVNIINNAKDALIENDVAKKKIEITLEQIDNEIRLKIKDNAGGIAEDIIEKVFNPYFSTKLAKEGTGLGLYMTKLIIEDHIGGSITVSNCEKGACFEIILKGIS